MAKETENTDTKPNGKKLGDRINMSTVITLCLAIAAGSWALSGEVHNYRLQNITGRLKNHEDGLMAAIEDRSQIWRAVDTLITLTENLHEDLGEIKTILQNK